jgi:hypothetical protein
MDRNMQNTPIHGHWKECPDVPGSRILVLFPKHSSFLTNWFHKIDWSDGETAVKHNAQVCREFYKIVIKAWQGFTIANLKRLCPELSIKGEDAQEISFSDENLDLLLRFSPNFLFWLHLLAFDNFKEGLAQIRKGGTSLY